MAPQVSSLPSADMARRSRPATFSVLDMPRPIALSATADSFRVSWLPRAKRTANWPRIVAARAIRSE
jgi:hypothetical protein